MHSLIAFKIRKDIAQPRKRYYNFFQTSESIWKLSSNWTDIWLLTLQIKYLLNKILLFTGWMASNEAQFTLFFFPCKVIHFTIHLSYHLVTVYVPDLYMGPQNFRISVQTNSIFFSLGSCSTCIDLEKRLKKYISSIINTLGSFFL